MTYKEMLKRYKNGELDDETRKLVEQDIEKYEAISDYLFSDDEPKSSECSNSECTSDEEKQFNKRLKKSIRKVFIRTGLIAGGAVLALVLTVIFVLPKVTDSFFYDPVEKPETAEGTELSTNSFTADFAAYSELFLPGRYRSVTTSERNGYGVYNINIIQSSSFTGRFRNISGRIERGSLTLTDSRAFGLPAADSFNFNSAGVYSKSGISNTGDYLTNNISLLNDSTPCMAYVTLDRVYSYGEFTEFCKNNGLYPDWMALCRTSESANGYPFEIDGILGIKYADACAVPFEFDEESYPYQDYSAVFEAREHVRTIIGNIENENDSNILVSEDPVYTINENIMKMHALSALDYLSTRKDFCKMMNVNTTELNKLRKDISETGLHIYGFVIINSKSEIVRISELSETICTVTEIIQ